MIIDALLQFSDAQTLTASAASTKTLDFSQEQPDLGLNTNLCVVVVPTTEFAGTSPTLKIELQDCDTDNGSFTTVLSTGALDATKLKANTPLILPMPIKHRRYVKLNYTIGGTASAGAVSAYVTDSLQANADWMPEV